MSHCLRGRIKPSVCGRDLVVPLTLGLGEQEEAELVSFFGFSVKVWASELLFGKVNWCVSKDMMV